MKLKEGFILREVAGECVVLPTGDELNLNAMITLNDTGRFIWEQLENETTHEQIVEALLAEYDVTTDVAAKCVADFVAKLESYDFLA